MYFLRTVINTHDCFIFLVPPGANGMLLTDQKSKASDLKTVRQLAEEAKEHKEHERDLFMAKEAKDRNDAMIQGLKDIQKTTEELARTRQVAADSRAAAIQLMLCPPKVDRIVVKAKTIENAAVTKWLFDHGMKDYAQTFADNGYDDLDIFPILTETDLMDIGMALAGHRKKFLMAVKKIGPEQPEQQPGTKYNTPEETSALFKSRSLYLMKIFNELNTKSCLNQASTYTLD